MPNWFSDFVGDRQQFQFATAVLASWRFGFFNFRLRHGAAEPIRPAPIKPHEPTDVRQSQFAVGTHPPVVADFLKPGRQNVLREGGDELVSRGVAGDPLVLARWFDPVPHAVRIDFLDSVVADGNPVDVRREVLEDRLTVADWFDIDDPVLFQHAIGEFGIQARLSDRFDKQLLVQAQRRKRMKELVPANLQPTLAVATCATAGNDEVNVGMVSAYVAAPGVQRSKETNLFASEILWLLHQRPNRLTACIEDRVIARLLIGAQQWTQLPGNRKGHDKMLHRQQFFSLLGKPQISLFLLAVALGSTLRAMT